MTYKPGGSYFAGFTTSDPATGAAVNADSLPVATANRNGSDDAAFVLTVANIDTGRYKVSGTVPSGYARGDVVIVFLAATVSGVAGKAEIDRFFIDSKFVGDLNDSPYNGGAVASVTGSVEGDVGGKVLGGGESDITGVGVNSNDVQVNGNPIVAFDGVVQSYRTSGGFSIVKLASTANTANGFYSGRLFESVGGTGPNQFGYVTGYVGGSTLEATLDRTLGTALADDTEYSITVPQAVGSAGQIQIESGVNLPQALSAILAASAGLVSGVGTGPIVIKGAGTSTTRITATTDSAGNRTAITLNLP